MAAGFGEVAAIGTAMTWGISSQVQSAVARMIGATGVTLLRQPYQIVFVCLMCLVFGANPEAGPYTLFLLFLSGLTGICLCDFFLYWGITIVGPSVAILLVSTSTVFSALFGWMFLQETLPLRALFGMLIIMSGILCVLSENRGSTLLPGQEVPTGRTLAFGVGLCLVAAVLLGVSFIFLKMALHSGVDPLYATLIRLLSGAATLWGYGLFRGWPKLVWQGIRSCPKVCWMLLFSCACGATGMWLASLAVKLTAVGIAATLISLQTVFVTMIGALWYRRMPSFRVIAGSLAAFGGTALVCLR